MLKKDKEFFHQREETAKEMIKKYWSFTINWLLNYIKELEEREQIDKTIISELHIEAYERNKEIKELYNQIQMLKL